jgi:hypothetical protein
MRTAGSFAFVAVVLLALAGAGACKRATSDANESKQLPKLAPPPEAGAATGLRIDVTIDGAPSAAIDHQKLDATKPDFEDGERRAWRIDTLVGAAGQREGAVFRVDGDKGMSVLLRRPEGDNDALPVLVLNRRGELLAAMVERSNPFPPYHGHGGRLERRGDPLPRVTGVTKIGVAVELADSGR